jgi:GNAT superfamily N-acetyltransferase
MSKVKVRRTNREELPGIVVLRDAAAAGLAAFPASRGVLDLEMKVDPDLTHLLTHDPDGFFTATDRDETLGFAAAHIRSRQWILSELWVLPQHHGCGAGEALLTRTLTYGERSGAREYLAIVPVENNVQALLLRHDLHPVAPVYILSLPVAAATRAGSALSRLLPGQNVTKELYKRRGQADLDRIDRLIRATMREVDHVYWLKERGMEAAFVRQGDRIAGYAYGSCDQVGPATGTTQDAALAALGWAINLALHKNRAKTIELRIPAPFAPAVDAVLELGGRLRATLMLYGRGLSSTYNRCLLGPGSLP